MTTAPEGVPSRPTSGLGAGKIVLTVVGALVALIGLGLLAGGGTLVWANGTQRDDRGFFTSATSRFASDRYAITGESVELTEGVPHRLSSPGDLATFGAAGTSVSGKAIFVGIGPAAAIDDYLDGVAHDEIVDLHMDGWKGRISADYRGQAGGSPDRAARRADVLERGDHGQSGLAHLAGAEGHLVDRRHERRRLTRRLGRSQAGREGQLPRLGRRRADRRRCARPARRRRHGVLRTALPADGGGAVAAAPAAIAGPATAEVGTEAGYPVTVDAELDPQLSRWMWLVKWILAIPHYVVLAFLWLAVLVLTIVAFFAILFTGRYPRGIFDFNVGVMRWTWRVAFYSYSVLGTDRYPPFTLADADYPARLDVPYPEHLSRGLVLVKSWLLAIPHYCVLAALVGSWSWPFTDNALDAWPGLNAILVVIAAVALLFTGRYRARDLRPRRGHQPLGAAGRRLRPADARRVPALPARS